MRRIRNLSKYRSEAREKAEEFVAEVRSPILLKQDWEHRNIIVRRCPSLPPVHYDSKECQLNPLILMKIGELFDQLVL